MNLTNAIPTSIQIGKFYFRLYCDQNRKSAPQGGGATQQPERRCFGCLSVSHMVWECQNEIVCRHCSRPGHKQKDCDDHRAGKTATAVTGEYINHLANYEETVDDAELVELSDHGEGEDEMLGVGDHNHNNMVIPDSDCKSVIIGDSLVKHVDNVGNAAVLAKSGLQASQVDEMLRVAETKLDMDKVEKVVFHLGVNDLNRNKQNPDIVRLNLAEAIVKVESAFPMVEVAVATIPPRKGKASPVNFYNETARDLNKYLELLTERNERLT